MKKIYNYKDIQEMVKNCTWLEDTSWHLFCNLQNKR